MEKQNLKLEYLPIEDIEPYKNNPRKHKEKQVRQIINSISEFNFNNPIIIDENNEVLAGHGRLLAAKKLQIEKVPTIRLTHLTAEQKRLYRIADNKLTENGEWDKDLLKLEFKELKDIEISLDITGFEMPQIEGFVAGKEELDEKLNDIPKVEEGEIVSKLGDIWQLGNHRIICGDSLKRATFEALMEDKKADIIFADSPYNLKINGQVCGKGAVKHEEFAMASGEMSSEEFQNFLRTTFALQAEFSKDGSIHFQCMDWRNVKEIMLAAEGVYTELKNICVWNKDNGGMGSLYRSKHELIFVFKNGTAPHINNVELGKNGRYRTNVWDYVGLNSFSGDRDLLKIHPTCKPVEMIRDAIYDVSSRANIVLDAFLGSGSTLVAAEKTKRICYGIELEPKYIDTAIKRWETLTKKDAVHIVSNQTYKSKLKAIAGEK
ncbi:DNA modification methylase [Elusimicrobium posterum]|uniref:site-specific DNA-methyltransferase n=1 Tax=Elusimicrobium posterum TaxID=3116653 RepID=UPI003C7366D7